MINNDRSIDGWMDGDRMKRPAIELSQGSISLNGMDGWRIIQVGFCGYPQHIQHTQKTQSTRDTRRMSWFRGTGEEGAGQGGGNTGNSSNAGRANVPQLPIRRVPVQQSSGYGQPQQQQTAPPSYNSPGAHPSLGGHTSPNARRGNKFEVVGTPDDSLVLLNVSQSS